MKANSIPTTLSLLLLTTAACGQVVGPDDPAGTPDPTSADAGVEDAPAEDAPDDSAPPPTPSPLVVEAPAAATTPDSLFMMSFAADSMISSLVAPDERDRIDVLQQRFVTRTDQPIELVVEVMPPTGTYARTIVSDTIQGGLWIEEYVPCHVGSTDPRCSTTVPSAHVLPASGAIMASRWRLRVVDAETGAAIAGCVDSVPGRVTCQLPAREGASYRVVASAWGFEELWNGTAIEELRFGSTSYNGSFMPEPEYRCFETMWMSGVNYCTKRYHYGRFNALDKARLDLDPIATTVTANGIATTLTSPALTWDAGDDDLPGMY